MATNNMELATLGAGCFWSTERSFRNEFGAKFISAVVGYMIENETICNNRKNHVEVLQISFDTTKLTYKDLVYFFFQMHDPTILNRQTTPYRSIIFTHTKHQHEIAEQIRDEFENNNIFIGQIMTEIQPIDRWTFSIAESKHQNYLDNKYGWLRRS